MDIVGISGDGETGVEHLWMNNSFNYDSSVHDLLLTVPANSGAGFLEVWYRNDNS